MRRKHLQTPRLMSLRWILPCTLVVLLLPVSLASTLITIPQQPGRLRGKKLSLNTNSTELQETPLQSQHDRTACRGHHARRQGLEHHEGWYQQCYNNLQIADSTEPKGKWTRSEFLMFVKLQFQESFGEFRTLPLPMIVTFHELACRCFANTGESNCCIGDKAAISGPMDEDPNRWLYTICNRVELALDNICYESEVPERSEF